MSYHYVMLCHIISCHVFSHYVISYVMSCGISCHVMYIGQMMLFHIMLCHVSHATWHGKCHVRYVVKSFHVLCYVNVKSYIMPYHIYHVICCHIMCHGMSGHVTYDVMSFHIIYHVNVMLCHVKPCHFMSYTKYHVMSYIMCNVITFYVITCHMSSNVMS